MPSKPQHPLSAFLVKGDVVGTVQKLTASGQVVHVPRLEEKSFKPVDQNTRRKDLEWVYVKVPRNDPNFPFVKGAVHKTSESKIVSKPSKTKQSLPEIKEQFKQQFMDLRGQKKLKAIPFNDAWRSYKTELDENNISASKKARTEFFKRELLAGM